jgi:hypothetical protein
MNPEKDNTKRAPKMQTQGSQPLPIDYTYPRDGSPHDTMAIMPDGRRIYVNLPHAQIETSHAAGCSKSESAIPRGIDLSAANAYQRAAICTCGALAGINEAALVADARVRGKFGAAPRATPAARTIPAERHGAGWCPKCETYCFSECDA